MIYAREKNKRGARRHEQSMTFHRRRHLYYATYAGARAEARHAEEYYLWMNADAARTSPIKPID